MITHRELRQGESAVEDAVTVPAADAHGYHRMNIRVKRSGGTVRVCFFCVALTPKDGLSFGVGFFYFNIKIADMAKGEYYGKG